MSQIPVRVGFLPLVDAALPILARELGFAEEEGLALDLVRDMSWATVLDRLLYGHSDAAHLVAPLAIATSLGLGRPAVSSVGAVCAGAERQRDYVAARTGRASDDCWRAGRYCRHWRAALRVWHWRKRPTGKG